MPFVPSFFHIRDPCGGFYGKTASRIDGKGQGGSRFVACSAFVSFAPLSGCAGIQKLPREERYASA